MKKIVNDRPDNVCFGCSPWNERGLQLEFTQHPDGLVESPYTAPPHFCGAEGVIHGGIQAALLDEVMGVAAHAGEDEGEERIHIVTVDFRLSYRRPAPVGVRLTLRARLLRREDRDYFVEGEIVDAEGTALTRAEARWRQVRAPASRG